MRKYLIGALCFFAASTAVADNAITLYDQSTTNYTQIRAPNSLAGSTRWLLPVQAGTTSQVLSIKSVAGNVIQTTWSNVSGGGGAASWGSIGGTLSNQADLQSALNAIAASTAATTARDVQIGVDTTTLRSQLVTGLANVATSTASLQTQITAAGVSTGSLQGQINNIYIASTTFTNGLLAVGLTTATLKTRIDNLDSSTATLTTRLIQVGVDTATLKTRVDNLDASTATITTRLVQVGLDTATLRTSLNTVATATTTLSQNFPVSLSTNVVGLLPIANGGTNTASPGLVPGTNITSITGSWPNQTINAATQGGGGGASSLAVYTGRSGAPQVQASSPTAITSLDQAMLAATLQGGATAFITVAFATNTVSATYAAVSTNSFVMADATGGSFTVTLATSNVDGTAINVGKVYTVKRMNAGANTVTVQGASGTIDGAATQVLTTQYTSIDIIWTGMNWSIE